MSATAVHLDPMQDHGLRDPASRYPGERVRSDSLSFSLVVCTLGRVEPLRRLLASLERQTLPVAEIIVVDQNPTDMLAEVLAQFPGLPIQRIRSERGLSRARNAGLAMVKGDVVGFPDDDCWYGPTVLAQVQALFHANPGLTLVTGRTLDDTGRPSLGAYYSAPTDITRRAFVECGNSNTLFVRRPAMLAIGDFDVRLGVGALTPFGSGEEADYLLRAVERGLPARYFPSLVVYHDQVEAVYDDSTLQRARTYSRGFGALMRKHRLGPGYFLYRECRTLFSAVLALLTLRTGRARYKLAWLRGVADGYRRWTD